MARAAGIDTGGFHAVEPKRDCPHCTPENIAPKEAFEGVHVNDPCVDCGNRGENWVCLKPGNPTVRCSRYVNSHMLAFSRQNEDHPIVFSFADFSFWCYKCDSYVVHPLLNHTEAFYLQKFAEDEPLNDVLQKMRDTKHNDEIDEADEDEDDEEEKKQGEEEKKQEEEEKKEDEGEPASGNFMNLDSLQRAIDDMTQPQGENDFSYRDLVNGLKEGKYRNILVLTGAGVSVSAGIPDFRSPGTGIYDNLAEYNLPRPEAIFDIGYFKEKPEPFYKFAQHFDLTRYNATPTHYFIKMLQDKGVLWKNMTQNIDNLEEKTGMDMGGVIQCHGANRGAECAGCRRKGDFEALQQAIRDQQILRCTKCTDQAPIKPNIVFFGEQLPAEFMESVMQIATQVDLCLIMGTALAVSPFNMLPTFVKEHVPKVLFNMENTDETGGMDFTERGRMKLFVQGKCDETIRKLATDCGWATDFDAVLPDFHKQAQ